MFFEHLLADRLNNNHTFLRRWGNKEISIRCEWGVFGTSMTMSCSAYWKYTVNWVNFTLFHSKLLYVRSPILCDRFRWADTMAMCSVKILFSVFVDRLTVMPIADSTKRCCSIWKIDFNDNQITHLWPVETEKHDYFHFHDNICGGGVLLRKIPYRCRFRRWNCGVRHLCIEQKQQQQKRRKTREKSKPY